MATKRLFSFFGSVFLAGPALAEGPLLPATNLPTSNGHALPATSEKPVGFEACPLTLFAPLARSGFDDKWNYGVESVGCYSEFLKRADFRTVDEVEGVLRPFVGKTLGWENYPPPVGNCPSPAVLKSDTVTERDIDHHSALIADHWFLHLRTELGLRENLEDLISSLMLQGKPMPTVNELLPFGTPPLMREKIERLLMKAIGTCALASTAAQSARLDSSDVALQQLKDLEKRADEIRPPAPAKRPAKTPKGESLGRARRKAPSAVPSTELEKIERAREAIFALHPWLLDPSLESFVNDYEPSRDKERLRQALVDQAKNAESSTRAQIRDRVDASGCLLGYKDCTRELATGTERTKMLHVIRGLPDPAPELAELPRSDPRLRGPAAAAADASCLQFWRGAASQNQDTTNEAVKNVAITVGLAGVGALVNGLRAVHAGAQAAGAVTAAGRLGRIAQTALRPRGLGFYSRLGQGAVALRTAETASLGAAFVGLGLGTNDTVKACMDSAPPPPAPTQGGGACESPFAAHARENAGRLNCLRTAALSSLNLLGFVRPFAAIRASSGATAAGEVFRAGLSLEQRAAQALQELDSIGFPRYQSIPGVGLSDQAQHVGLQLRQFVSGLDETHRAHYVSEIAKRLEHAALHHQDQSERLLAHAMENPSLFDAAQAQASAYQYYAEVRSALIQDGAFNASIGQRGVAGLASVEKHVPGTLMARATIVAARARALKALNELAKASGVPFGALAATELGKRAQKSDQGIGGFVTFAEACEAEAASYATKPQAKDAQSVADAVLKRL